MGDNTSSDVSFQLAICDLELLLQCSNLIVLTARVQLNNYTTCCTLVCHVIHHAHSVASDSSQNIFVICVTHYVYSVDLPLATIPPHREGSILVVLVA